MSDARGTHSEMNYSHTASQPAYGRRHAEKRDVRMRRSREASPKAIHPLKERGSIDEGRGAAARYSRGQARRTNARTSELEARKARGTVDEHTAAIYSLRVNINEAR